MNHSRRAKRYSFSLPGCTVDALQLVPVLYDSIHFADNITKEVCGRNTIHYIGEQNSPHESRNDDWIYQPHIVPFRISRSLLLTIYD